MPNNTQPNKQESGSHMHQNPGQNANKARDEHSEHNDQSKQSHQGKQGSGQGSNQWDADKKASGNR